MKSIKIVKLSDNKTCIEFEETYVGGSETQVVYSYYYDGQKLDTAPYKVGWSGQIENLIEISRVDTINDIIEISRKVK